MRFRNAATHAYPWNNKLEEVYYYNSQHHSSHPPPHLHPHYIVLLSSLFIYTATIRLQIETKVSMLSIHKKTKHPSPTNCTRFSPFSHSYILRDDYPKNLPSAIIYIFYTLNLIALSIYNKHLSQKPTLFYQSMHTHTCYR